MIANASRSRLRGEDSASAMQRGTSDTRNPQMRGQRRGGGGPTVADVARAAGVSPMTVSRVVNREANVLPATRDKVTAAIAALGYVPNRAARSLAGGQQCRIALLHNNPSATYLSALLMGALDGVRAAEAELIVEQHATGDSFETLVARLTAHRVDAVLLPGPLCDDRALLAALRDAGLPIAQVSTGRPEAFAHAVTIDDEGAAHAVTRRLTGLGHRRIGLIGGHPGLTASALRRTGYVRALREAGLDADPALIVPGDFTYRSGLAGAERLLALPIRPTAIFASNDDMAAAVVSVASRRGLEVPRDLSVCGFDDIALATSVWPELTTIHQPVAEMAGNAIRLLAASVRRRGDSPGTRHVRHAYTLVVRGSDGPPGPHDRTSGGAATTPWR